MKNKENIRSDKESQREKEIERETTVVRYLWYVRLKKGVR